MRSAHQAGLSLLLLACTHSEPPAVASSSSPLLVSNALEIEPLTVGRGGGEIQLIASAWAGTHHLVAWSAQFRDLHGNGLAGWGVTQVARVSPTGQLLDAVPVDLGVQADFLQSGLAAAASVSSDTLVVWTTESPYAIVAGRVDAAGRALDATPLTVILTGGASTAMGEPGSCGGDYLVPWSLSSNVFAGRVSAAGALLDPGGIFVAAASPYANVSAAGATSSWLVVWDAQASPLRAVRIDRSGAVLGAPSALGPGIIPSTAWNGHQYLVAFLAIGRVGVRAVRLDESAGVLDATPIVISDGGVAALFYVHVAGLDGGFAVTWSGPLPDGGPENRMARLLDDGTVLDPGGIADGPGPPLHLGSVASGFDTGLLAAIAGDGSGVEGETFSLGMPPTPAFVTTGPNAQAEPSVAFQGGRYFVAWNNTPPADVRLATLSPGGTRLGTDLVFDGGARVAIGATADTVLFAFVRGGLVAVRDSAAGSPGLPGLLSTGGSYQDLGTVAGPSQFLVTWTDSILLGPPPSISGLLLEEQADAGVPFSVPFATFDSRARAAFDGTQFVVVWDASLNDGGSKLLAARVALDGGVLDSSPLQLGLGHRPSVASRGGEWWVASISNAPPQALLQRFSPAGVPLAAASALGVAADQRFTELGWSGTRCLMAWPVDAGTMLAELELDGGGATTRLLDGAAYPALAFAGGDAGLLVYERNQVSPYLPQVMFRVYGAAADGDPCSVGSDCASGACVAQLCCEGSCPPPDGGQRPDGGVGAPDGGAALPDGGSASAPDGGRPVGPWFLEVGCGAAPGSVIQLLAAGVLLRCRRRRGAKPLTGRDAAKQPHEATPRSTSRRAS